MNPSSADACIHFSSHRNNFPWVQASFLVIKRLRSFHSIFSSSFMCEVGFGEYVIPDSRVCLALRRWRCRNMSPYLKSGTWLSHGSHMLCTNHFPLNVLFSQFSGDMDFYYAPHLSPKLYFQWASSSKNWPTFTFDEVDFRICSKQRRRNWDTNIERFHGRGSHSCYVCGWPLSLHVY